MSALAEFRQIRSLSSVGELRQAVTISGRSRVLLRPLLQVPGCQPGRCYGCGSCAEPHHVASSSSEQLLLFSGLCLVSVISDLESVRSGAEGHSDKASARCLSYRPRVTIATI